MLIVQKYGGTSLMDTDRVRVAAMRAAEAAKSGNQVVVVVSAQGKTTDQLIKQAKEILDQPSAREMDAFLASGEQMSAGFMAMMLHSLGQKAISLTGWQAGLHTDEVHGNARVLGLNNDRIKDELKQGNIVVVAGFQGINDQGDITTLGRGGSDTTAVALAALLGADVCQIYTDVDGVYDKDPRKFPDAVKYQKISYQQMLTLARNGAQVLHDRCVEIAMEYRIPVQVLSSFRPGPGTMVID